MELKLCYCANNIMYFTSDMTAQWGDDWDDRPYEHNAGSPYETHTTVNYPHLIATQFEVGA